MTILPAMATAVKTGAIRRSGGFSDLKKRPGFEGRASRLHEIFGFGTRGSARTTRNHTFQTKSLGAFWKLDHQPGGDTINTVFWCILRVSAECKGKCWSAQQAGILVLSHMEGWPHSGRKLAWCRLAHEATEWLHETVGFGTCGSPATTRFKQNSRLLFQNYTINHEATW